MWWWQSGGRGGGSGGVKRKDIIPAGKISVGKLNSHKGGNKSSFCTPSSFPSTYLPVSYTSLTITLVSCIAYSPFKKNGDENDSLDQIRIKLIKVTHRSIRLPLTQLNSKLCAPHFKDDSFCKEEKLFNDLTKSCQHGTHNPI